MKYLNDVLLLAQDRFHEIKELRTIHNLLSTGEQKVIIKSSIFLLLYNTVEGTFSVIMRSLFDYIRDNQIHIDKLNPSFQNIYYKYYLKIIGDRANLLSNTYHNKKLTDISFKEVDKYLKLFSGNLDARHIRNVSLDFGINIPEKYKKKEIGTKLLVVKNIRNNLSHGEKSFSHASRDFTIEEIDEICEDVNFFLKLVIDRYDVFIDDLDSLK